MPANGGTGGPQTAGGMPGQWIVVFQSSQDLVLLSVFPLPPGVGRWNLILDPTPAMSTDRINPLIATADNLCQLAVLEWDGAKLSVLWQAVSLRPDHSSPAVLSANLVSSVAETERFWPTTGRRGQNVAV